MSEPSQGRSRDDPPNHQDCAQTSQISGVWDDHPRLQTTAPPTIYPNGFRAAAGADPACMAASRCVGHSLPSLSLAIMIKVIKSWGFAFKASCLAPIPLLQTGLKLTQYSLSPAKISTITAKSADTCRNRQPTRGNTHLPLSFKRSSFRRQITIKQGFISLCPQSSKSWPLRYNDGALLTLQ